MLKDKIKDWNAKEWCKLKELLKGKNITKVHFMLDTLSGSIKFKDNEFNVNFEYGEKYKTYDITIYKYNNDVKSLLSLDIWESNEEYFTVEKKKNTIELDIEKNRICCLTFYID